MNTLEKNLWSVMKTHLDKIKNVHYQRIETGQTGRGIPDVNIKSSATYSDAWVELKVVNGRKVELRPEQVAWHLRRVAAGGRTFILAREKKEGPRTGKVDRLYLWEGGLAVAVLERGLDCPAVVFNAPFDWNEIFWRMGLVVRA